MKVTIEPWHEYFILKHGRETFYDDTRHMITFDTVKDAILWSEKHLHTTPDNDFEKKV